MKMFTAAAAALLALGSIAQAADLSADECRAKLQTVDEAGLLKGSDDTDPNAFRIIVDGGVWKELDFRAKTMIAECFNTVLLGERSGKMLSLKFMDHRSNEVIGRFPPYRE